MTDYADLVDRINRTTREFASEAAARACEELVERIGASREPAPPAPVRKVLSLLRNKRYFAPMERVAAAAMASGQHDPQVRRQYAQGLIDQGSLTTALKVLADLVADTSPGGATPNLSEHAEARGLVGRANKQAYVNAVSAPSLAGATGNTPLDGEEYRRRALENRAYLEKAIHEYGDVYRSDPDRYLWHGINTVACVCRADRDGLQLEGRPDPRRIAEDILAGLEAIEPRKKVQVWDRATAIEACVALGRLDDALGWLDLYVKDESADAFEFGSTLRQLTEVWQLTSEREPGSRLLPVLHAARLQREGGNVDFAAGRQSAAIHPERLALEAILGDTRFLAFRWYREGLKRCESVARVETKWGEAYGSGFLVRGEDMHAAFTGKVLLLTNAHVISDDPAVQKGTPPALPPARARVRFEAREADGGPGIYAIKRIVWTSPPTELDATLLELEGTLSCDPPYPLAVGLPAPDKDRVYVIGHPRGQGLAISMQDNRVVDAKKPRLRYRAPTEQGSSGSPVFNQDWELVALHHAGSKYMPSLSGPGLEEANEGIWISAIVEALKEKFVAAGG
jgi:V8-like Glu-specific endopeptidase